MSKSKLVSGNPAPSKGVYKEVGPRGGDHGMITIPSKGTTMPPTDKPNSHFVKSMNDGKLVSGSPAPSKGIYKEVGPRGGDHGMVTIPSKGTTMPPTDKPNSHFVKK